MLVVAGLFQTSPRMVRIWHCSSTGVSYRLERLVCAGLRRPLGYVRAVSLILPAGTSLSSPIVASMITMINQERTVSNQLQG